MPQPVQSLKTRQMGATTDQKRTLYLRPEQLTDKERQADTYRRNESCLMKGD